MGKIRNLSLWCLLWLGMVCSGCQSEPEPADSELTVVVSIEPLRYFTEQVAGDRVRVVTMVPGGSSPETYEPTPQQLVDLDNSRAYFRVGSLGFEQTWLSKFVDNAPGLKVYDTSKGIAPVYEKHRHGDREISAVDPHTWMSPANAHLIARNICQALCELDTAGADVYRRRLAVLDRRIDSLDTVVRRLLAGVRHRTFLVYHPALGHFARDYGLRQLCIESEGREPSPALIRRLVSRCRSEQVQVVLLQKEYAATKVEQVAHDVGARIAVINPLSYDWPHEVTEIARQIAHGKE